MGKVLTSFILLFCCLGGIVYVVGESKSQEIRKVTDADFALLEKEISPDQKHIALSYQYDQGALGYSRVWWAVVPQNFEDLNLAKFELPDGYKAVAWEKDNGHLIVVRWEPYYARDEQVDLSTGDTFHGVHIRIIPSLNGAEDYSLLNRKEG